MYVKRCKTVVSLCLSGVLCLLMPLFAYANSKASITADNVNFRSSPNLQSNVLSKLKRSTPVNVLEVKSDWVHIEYQGKKGWVSAQFIKITDAPKGSGAVSAMNVNIRTEPSLDAKVMTRVSSPKVFNYYERFGDWYKIKLDEGSFGWIHKNFFRLRDNNSSRSLQASDEDRDLSGKSNAQESLNNSNSEASDANVTGDEESDNAADVDMKNNSAQDGGLAEDKSQNDASQNFNDNEQQDLAAKIIVFAKELLGVRYRYGEMSPQKGFDCSGFTSYVFNHFGIKLERSSLGQTNNGILVKRSQLKPGDLVFFDTNGGKNKVNHVGIYIGDGKFIHASSGSNNGKKVVISPLNEGFYNNCYMTARRVIGNK